MLCVEFNALFDIYYTAFTILQNSHNEDFVCTETMCGNAPDSYWASHFIFAHFWFTTLVETVDATGLRLHPHVDKTTGSR